MNKQEIEKTMKFLDSAQEKNVALAKFVFFKIVPRLVWYAVILFIWLGVFNRYGTETTFFLMAVTVIILLGNIYGGIEGIRRFVEQPKTK